MNVIGRVLKDKYDTAVKVTYTNSDKELLPRRSDRSVKIVDQLIFVQKSPDFCTKNPNKDILGTTGRQCNISSTGPDSCETLCCDRGVIQMPITVIQFFYFVN
jgi:hypothetical protein